MNDLKGEFSKIVINDNNNSNNAATGQTSKKVLSDRKRYAFQTSVSSVTRYESSTITTQVGNFGSGRGSSSCDSFEESSSANSVMRKQPSPVLLDENRGDKSAATRASCVSATIDEVKAIAAIRRNYVSDDGASSGSLNMSILFVGLLEVILSRIERDKNVRENLLKVVLLRLNQSKVFPNVTEVLDELKPLRKTYLKGFWNIIQDARKACHTLIPLSSRVQTSSAIDLQTLSLPYPKAMFGDFVNASRYEDNFEELEIIGKGGFGIVYKARNRVDLAFYAIKKIFLKDFSHDNKIKILREARVIASLKHPNVVTYHTAWLEYVHTLPPCMAKFDRKKKHTLFSVSTDSKYVRSLNSDMTSVPNTLSKPKQSKSNTNSTNKRDNEDSNGYLNCSQRSISSESEGGIFFGTDPTASCDGAPELKAAKLQSAMTEDVKNDSDTSSDRYVLSDKVLPCGEECEEDIDATIDVTELSHSSRERQRAGPSFSRSFSCPQSGEDKFEGVSSILSSTSESRPCLPVAPLKHTTNSSSQDINSGCFALFIQMEIYHSSLKQWVNERNLRPAISQRLTSIGDCAGSDWDKIDHKSNLIVFKQILQSLQYIHSRNIIHRDIKLQNIFIDPNSLHIWLGDFGLAREINISESIGNDHGDATSKGDNDCHKSSTSLFDASIENGYQNGFSYGLSQGIGSQPYVAPELLQRSESYDSKIDMFSVGIILFELYAPFGTKMERAKLIDQLKKSTTVPLPAMQYLKDNWPTVCKVIEQLVSHDPSMRPSAKFLLESDLFKDKEELCMRSKLSGDVDKDNTNSGGELQTRIARLEAENVDLKRCIQKLKRSISTKDRIITRMRKQLQRKAQMSYTTGRKV